jgi:hypothetical protein
MLVTLWIESLCARLEIGRDGWRENEREREREVNNIRLSLLLSTIRKKNNEYIVHTTTTMIIKVKKSLNFTNFYF